MEIENNKSKLDIDGDFYITMNKLYDSFVNTIEDLSQTSNDFWSGFCKEEFKIND